ncbi:MAG TPA: DUF4245 domain-containing protein [Micromonosporaceae bacterium]|nr:DUF4245 domain-containing protein [Micromonosporaceae bacterium]
METAPPTSPTGPAASPADGLPEHRPAGRGPRDMALSLLVLLVPVLLVVGAYRVLYQGDRPVVVDPAPAIAQARAAGIPVAEPTALGSGWRPASAQLTRGDLGPLLRIGYLTPTGAGAQLVQSSGPADQVLAAELTGAARTLGSEEIGGRTWQRYAARPGERALVLLEPGRTVMVLGTAPDGELRELAASLS